ncbi:TonB-dependent receptor [Galbibacter sp. EGI 63066]|uniref:TonB-dependent receptor n=1 Tax=Galbibacter sp. EGI 63066 TaxID=2993559 RepID=UPI0022488515|nr:TonB-dependent receptor [Galbibacter sp. EGI 63066]MCX2681989.1 TonB-dependent receptor [Galbibacter sp. EGI 63066]
MIKWLKASTTLLVLFFSISFYSCYAQTTPDVFSKDIYVTGRKITVSDLFKLIKEANIKLTYSSNDIDLSNELSLDKNQYTVREILNLVVSNSDVRIVLKNDKIILTSQPIGKNTISGFVREEGTNEVLIGAIVSVLGTNYGVITNSYGFYNLILDPGEYEIEISYTGYKKQKKQIEIQSNNINQDFFLIGGIQLESVVVVSELINKKPYNTSDKRITNDDIRRFPVLLGESDPLKVLKQAAGVSGSVGSSTLKNVRGGNPDENLVLIDGVPVYNYNHLGSIVSIFNTHSIKQVDFYKSAFHPKYNGRLSSVIDVRTKDGDMEEYHGNLNLSPITFSASFEGPIKKEKASFISSFRRSSVDLISKLISGNSDLNYYFYDYNFKTNYILKNSDRIFLSAYVGKDNLKLDEIDLLSLNDLVLNWSNQLVALKWNHIHNSRTFQHFSLTYSNFNNYYLGNLFEVNSRNDNAINSELNSRINDLSFNTEMEHSISEKSRMDFGLSLKLVRFNNSYSRNNSNGSLTQNEQENKSFHLNAYVENRIQLNKKLLFKAGVNFANYFLDSKSYNFFLPRLSVYYTLNKNNYFFGSYSSVSQFNHEITPAIISLPNEFRIPSTKSTPPKLSEAFEIGYNYHFRKKNKLGIRAYYKNIDGIITYRPGQDILTSNLALDMEDRILRGSGTRKGIELETTIYLKKYLNLEAAYTLSKTDNSFDGINQGETFPSIFDYRNIFNTAIYVDITKNISFNTTFSYSSGTRVNIPVHTYPDIDDSINVNPSTSLTFQGSSPNLYKLPNNYILNLGGNYEKKFENNTVLDISAGLYNAIGNTSPLVSGADFNEDNNKIEISQISLNERIPYINISYSF